MYTGKKVSVVFPAFNEAANIAYAVRDFLACPAVDEVVVVDNNSTDQTRSLARKAGAKVVQEQQQGYGFALRKGMAVASGELIVLAEPDGTFRADDLPSLLRLSSRYDAVLGSRTHLDFIVPHANMGWLLRTGNICLAAFLQWLHETPQLTDCGCTFRVLRKSAVDTILPWCTVGGSYFLPEVVLLLQQGRFSMIELPVHYYPRVGESKITGSLWRAVRVALQMTHLIVDYYFEPKTNLLKQKYR